MLNTPFAPWPSFSTDEIEAVQAVLVSNQVNYWTGQECRLFEKEFAQWVGVPHALALANGTLALDLALKALDIGPGDEVIVTPRTFIASVSCVVNAGATPVFADVELDSGNLSARTIAKVITPQTKAIICVHLAGWPCDLDPIMALAEKHNFYVIEDCAQAHGSQYKGRSVGSIGHIGAWSFCQDKIMTTGGEGGMVTTRDEALWRKMWAYKDHGKSYEAVYERDHPPGYRWLHESFGTNWRMLEMQAAIGRVQLKKMPNWLAQRHANAHLLLSAFAPLADDDGSLRLPQIGCASGCGQKGCGKDTCGAVSGAVGEAMVRNATDVSVACPLGCIHAFYKLYFYIKLKFLNDGWSRDRIIEQMNKAGVPCYSGSCSEVYLEKAFDGTGWRPKTRLQNAQVLGETSIMFLVHPTLTRDQLQKTIQTFVDLMALASNSNKVAVH
jgi:dTDP-4-amino-4,6-dideoxygalactose transaminase